MFINFSAGSSPENFDLVYVIDTSDRIQSSQLEDVVKMMKAQLALYKIDDKKVRVAIVTFSDKPQLIHKLEEGNDKNEVFKKLFDVKKTNGIGNLADAMEFVQRNVIKNRNRKVPLTVLAVTSKNPNVNEENSLRTSTNQLKNAGAKIIMMTLDPNGLIGQIGKVSNVFGGSISPDGGDLTNVFDDTMDAIKKATGLFL